jgi:hypothetical protein
MPKNDEQVIGYLKKPSFAFVGLACLIAAFPFGRISAALFAPSEDLLGYEGIAAGLVGFGGVLLLGFILGCISLFRKERPMLFSSLITIMNSAALFWLLSKWRG